MNELLLEKYAYKKKRSVLSSHIEDIRTLLEHDATQKSILEYLKNEKDIVVTQPYLSMFIKKNIHNIQTTTESKQIRVSTPKKEEQVDKVQTTNKAAVTNNEVPTHPYFDINKIAEIQKEAQELDQTYEEALSRHEMIYNLTQRSSHKKGT